MYLLSGNLLHNLHGSANLGHKDKYQDRSGTNEKSSAEDSGETIDKPLQSVGGDDDDC